jgi:protein-disulfide isomerase
VKKTQQRFWITMIVAVVVGACVIIGLKLAMGVVITNNNLIKEELTLSREIVNQLSEMKDMIGLIQTNKLEQKIPSVNKLGAVPPKVPPQPGSSKFGAAAPEEIPARIPVRLGSQKFEGVTSGGNQVKGAANAPVLIVEFSDFECPFSKRFYQETFPQIEKEYISTGKVKFAFRDFPLPFHDQAMPAAIASRCAGEQGKYWEMFAKLLSSAEKLDSQVITISAHEAGLNKEEFTSCFNDPASKEQVMKDLKEGAKFNIGGTPVFFINGRKVEGALPFEAFKQVIEEELNSSKK